MRAGRGALRGRLAAAVRERVAPPLAALLIRALRRTLRLRAHGREVVERFAAENRRYVHVFWHAHLLMMVYSYVGPRLAFLISRHRDGELIARTVERFGYVPVRGSTTRGGAAGLRRLLREVKRGADIGFTPDGPRGPARRVQPGAVAAARLAGIPIVPVAFAAERAWELRTWDRFVVPKPFSRALIAYGRPLEIGRDEPLEAAAARLERALNDLEAFARLHAGDPAVGRPVRER
ncbi:MAG: DUF374 domain-containing protein [Acidobacteria bacterium]|nr:MAG: DUF374 domain-containing protein [Acidobacteriota bacterium]